MTVQPQPQPQTQSQTQPHTPTHAHHPPTDYTPTPPPPPTPTPRPPKPPVTALTGLALLTALGPWLVAAPFVLGEQPRAAAWTTATRVDMTAGATLTLIALVGLLGYLGAAVGWTARYGRS